MAIHAVTTKEIPKRELRVPPVHLVGAESLYGPVTTKEIPKRELRELTISVLRHSPLSGVTTKEIPKRELRVEFADKTGKDILRPRACYNKRNPKKGIERRKTT
jgi:hypothetical protein